MASCTLQMGNLSVFCQQWKLLGYTMILDTSMTIVNSCWESKVLSWISLNMSVRSKVWAAECKSSHAPYAPEQRLPFQLPMQDASDHLGGSNPNFTMEHFGSRFLVSILIRRFMKGNSLLGIYSTCGEVCL
jgi:hypothetical protein